MKFSEKCSYFLKNKLFIKVDEFQSTLENKFGENAQFFDDIINFILDDKASTMLPQLTVILQSCEFKKFTARCINYIKSKWSFDEGALDYIYEVICYFGWYYSGGLIELFKHRQAENGGPRIYLREPIVKQSVLAENLPAEVTIYRGMSCKEHRSGLYGMSWSMSEAKAKEFAFDIYSDKPRGVVLKATIHRSSVLYYSPEDSEKEIVVEYQTISGGELVHQ